MLTTLDISNFILIDRLKLQFQDGLCVLTGETGAGKSILLDALAFVLGQRANISLVRTGAAYASVVAGFAIENLHAVKAEVEKLDINITDDDLIIRRSISKDGRSKIFINDQMVSLNTVKDIATKLVEIHSQHEHGNLLYTKYHLEILDNFGALQSQLALVQTYWQEYSKLNQYLKQLKEQNNKAQAEYDYLKFISDELTKLTPQENEEEELSKQRVTLQNKEKFAKLLSELMDNLSGENSVSTLLAKSQSLVIKNNLPGEKFVLILKALEKAEVEIDEAMSLLAEINGDIENDISLDEVEERLFALRAAARKHRITVNELPKFFHKIKERLALAEQGEERLTEISSKLADAKKNYLETAIVLSKARKEQAKKLQQSVLQELIPLKMEKADFLVNINEKDEKDWSSFGIDSVEFLASTNPGTILAPLAKIASGGELSRFMLALKVVLSNIRTTPVLIFDEVDSGTGGAVADSIGKRLAKLAKNYQVFIITHQPQIACQADYHYKVHKNYINGTTQIMVEKLKDEQRENEIARMLSGENITSEAKVAARALIGVSS